LAIKNVLLALVFEALIELGFEIYFQKGCGLDRYFHSVFGIGSKFPRQQSDRILPYFCGENLATLRPNCIRAHKTLFSPSFHCENTTMEVPYFHGKNLAEFRIWCAMTNW